jgi:hypothetical protein
MVKWLKELFSGGSNASMSRFALFVLVMNGCGLAWYGIVENRDLNAVSILVGVILGTGFGGKVANFKYENKVRSPGNTDSPTQ